MFSAKTSYQQRRYMPKYCIYKKVIKLQKYLTNKLQITLDMKITFDMQIMLIKTFFDGSKPTLFLQIHN